VVKKTNIVLGVTGSIAAYKAAELVRAMIKKGWGVSVIMTQCAQNFVSELTFRTLSKNAVGLDMFEMSGDWMPEHISFADRADVFVVAPCTANIMAKLAHGIADDLLSCSLLATESPVVIAPAMNDNMWNHASTRANVEVLKSRGVQVIDVSEGDLACGREGSGRMAPVEVIVASIAGMVEALP